MTNRCPNFCCFCGLWGVLHQLVIEILIKSLKQESSCGPCHRVQSLKLIGRETVIDDDGHLLLRAKEPFQHDVSALDESEEGAAECGSAEGNKETLTHGEEVTDRGTNDNGVPGVFLLAGKP
ncbi:uncharacterized protein HKW66_Vig0006960 [Vigna angularis]|uniref:Uncharacterized protein n=1 Tax=Phaseolus angularis TaxID=3914 RepID=A0A8T0LEX4_PHAAN|nr:uncharacterized protein HKW66_Vig0006960 [Vigna angularis]